MAMDCLANGSSVEQVCTQGWNALSLPLWSLRAPNSHQSFLHLWISDLKFFDRTLDRLLFVGRFNAADASRRALDVIDDPTALGFGGFFHSEDIGEREGERKITDVAHNALERISYRLAITRTINSQ
jgi:hypothetical protein